MSNNNDSVRVCVTLSAKLLSQLDAVASTSYTSRSNAVRLALIDWFSSHPRRAKAANEQFKPPPLPPKPATELLNAEQQEVVARIRRGEAPFRALNEVGVTPEMQIELSMSGEI